MQSPTTSWRVSPIAWIPIALGVAAESAFNALRAYELGSQLDRFTVSIYGHPVSIPGAVLVGAAIAVSLAQGRAAWVALIPGPLRQRIIAGAAAALLLVVSGISVASHLLEMNRSKTGDEGNSRARYDRTAAEYEKASAEIKGIGKVRTVAEVEAAMRSTPVETGVWRRSNGCHDVTREDTRKECEPYFKLLTERAAAVRKAELEAKAESLRAELEKKRRPEEASTSESWAASIWAWIMGAAVVLIATFGPVIFARVEEVAPRAPQETEVADQAAISQPVPPTNGGHRHDIPVDHPVIVALRRGPAQSNDELADRLRESKSEASKKRGEVREYLVEQRVGGGRVVIDLKPEVRQAIG